MGRAHFTDVTIRRVLSLGAESTLEGNLIPDTPDLRTLGDSTHKFLALYVVDLNADNIIFPVQLANVVFAGPTSGLDAAPAFRTLVAADLPTFIAGSAGTDFNISGVTFNIPSASATARGLITTAAQVLAGNKTFNGTVINTSGPTVPAFAMTGDIDEAKWLTSLGGFDFSFYSDNADTFNLDAGATISFGGRTYRKKFALRETGEVSALAYRFGGNFANPSDATAAIYDQALIGPTLSGLSIEFRTGSPIPASRWRVGSTGHFLAATDNTYDVGASNGSRPRSIYLGDTIANRRLVLWTDVDNDHQFFGYGIEASTLRAQIPSSAHFYRWYRGDSASASTLIMELQGDGQLSLPVATGTAPLVIASTTVNTNLNADLLDGEHASEFINVGANPITVTDAPAAGETLVAASSTQAAWQPPPTAAGTFLYKSADQTVNNSTTLVTDNHLVATLVSSTTYYIRLHARISSVSTTSGMQATLESDGTLTANNVHLQFSWFDGDSATPVLDQTARVSDLNTIAGNAVFTTTISTLIIEGTIEVAVGGVLNFRWAQGTAEATNLNVQRGSIMIVQALP